VTDHERLNELRGGGDPYADVDTDPPGRVAWLKSEGKWPDDKQDCPSIHRAHMRGEHP
jgi:hypothetical protein